MPYKSDSKLLYIHIPKTGGTSVASALGLIPKDGKADYSLLYGVRDDGLILHTIPLSQYSLFLSPRQVQEALVFTVVRNPYDRAVSDYCWLKRTRRTFLEYLKLCKKTLQMNPMHLLYYDEHLFPNHFLPQYFFTECSQRKVDKILKFENLQEEFKALFPDLELPHLNGPAQRKRDIAKADQDIADLINATNFKHNGPSHTVLEDKKDLSFYYKSNEEIDLVCELYEKDFSTFGYPQKNTFHD